MKKLLLSCLAIAAIAITTQAQDTYNGAIAGNSYQFATGQTGTVTLNATNPYTWTKQSGDADLTLGTTTNQAIVTVNVAAAASNGDQAIFQVIANSDATCNSTARTITVTVGNATFGATIAAATNAVCQAGTYSVPVVLNAGTGIITAFQYFVDAGNDHVRTTEPLLTGTLTSQTVGSISVNTAAFGVQDIVIYSVSGTVAGTPVVSGIAYTGSHQAVTVNELPVLSPIVPN